MYYEDVSNASTSASFCIAPRVRFNFECHEHRALSCSYPRRAPSGVVACLPQALASRPDFVGEPLAQAAAWKRDQNGVQRERLLEAEYCQGNRGRGGGEEEGEGECARGEARDESAKSAERVEGRAKWTDRSAPCALEVRINGRSYVRHLRSAGLSLTPPSKIPCWPRRPIEHYRPRARAHRSSDSCRTPCPSSRPPKREISSRPNWATRWRHRCWRRCLRRPPPPPRSVRSTRSSSPPTKASDTRHCNAVSPPHFPLPAPGMLCARTRTH
eukprot:917374-Pleurochrysis_carterae.AAC.2